MGKAKGAALAAEALFVGAAGGEVSTDEPEPDVPLFTVYAVGIPHSRSGVIVDRWYDRGRFRIPCVPRDPVALDVTEAELRYLSGCHGIQLGATAHDVAARVPLDVRMFLSKQTPELRLLAAQPIPDLPPAEPEAADKAAVLAGQIAAAGGVTVGAVPKGAMVSVPASNDMPIGDVLIGSEQAPPAAPAAEGDLSTPPA